MSCPSLRCKWFTGLSCATKLRIITKFDFMKHFADEEIIEEVYQKFGEVIERRGSEFIIVSNNLTPDHTKVRYINQFIQTMGDERWTEKSTD